MRHNVARLTERWHFIVLWLLMNAWYLWWPLPLHAEWRFIGPVAASPAQGNAMMFHNSRAQVSITALAADLVRVRMAPGVSFGPDYSYAVTKSDWPPMQVAFSDNAGVRILRTPEIEVRVQLSPMRLSFYDTRGTLISKDADNLGMAWDGPRVRCWKWMPPDEHYFGLGEKSDGLDKRGHAYVMWNTDAYGMGTDD